VGLLLIINQCLKHSVKDSRLNFKKVHNKPRDEEQGDVRMTVRPFSLLFFAAEGSHALKFRQETEAAVREAE